MYSLTALPSSSRAAPAKNRRLSTTTGTSSIAAPTGLPAFWLSSRPISSTRASIASASFRSAPDRSAGVAEPQAGNALSAAWTARSTSSAPLFGTRAITWSLAGLITSSVSPDAESAHSPPMNCLYVLTRSSVSVIGRALLARGGAFPARAASIAVATSYVTPQRNFVPAVAPHGLPPASAGQGQSAQEHAGGRSERNRVRRRPADHAIAAARPAPEPAGIHRERKAIGMTDREDEGADEQARL